MTGKNWMTAIALTGGAAVLAALIPSNSAAKTYTGKPGSDFAMVSNPAVTPSVVVPVSSRHAKTTAATHKKKATTLTHHRKHKKLKHK